jgi:hypothetical protein
MPARFQSVVRAAAAVPIALAMLAGTVTAAGHDHVVNGTFDTDLAGWTVPVSGGCGNTTWVADGNPGGSAWLNACGEADSDPSLEQEITDLVIGETYTLAGEYRSVAAAFGDPNKPDAFEARIDGVPVLSLPRPDPATSWTSFGVEFQATATSHTISFVAELDGDDSDFAIDNISVMAVVDASPEPTAEPTAEPTPVPTVTPSAQPTSSPDASVEDLTAPPTDTLGPDAAPRSGFPAGAIAAVLAVVVLLAVGARPRSRTSTRRGR